MIVFKYANPDGEELTKEFQAHIDNSEELSKREKAPAKEFQALRPEDLGFDVFSIIIEVVVSKVLEYALDQLCNYIKTAIKNKQKGTVAIRLDNGDYLQDIDLETADEVEAEKLRVQIKRRIK